MNIRRAEHSDIESMLRIFAHAREFMASYGNDSQWGSDYPSRELIQHDIAEGNAFVVENDGGVVCATFCHTDYH